MCASQQTSLAPFSPLRKSHDSGSELKTQSASDSSPHSSPSSPFLIDLANDLKVIDTTPSTKGVETETARMATKDGSNEENSERAEKEKEETSSGTVDSSQGPASPPLAKEC
jgi:hypothetical protein